LDNYANMLKPANINVFNAYSAKTPQVRIVD
jgi:hypothetical protein